ncbi:hypothetical protein TNCV_3392961 [Trichonephila clavipes]|nr:hypothetical protein TNCV_3392961 [Trichonephila clavipes]
MPPCSPLIITKRKTMNFNNIIVLLLKGDVLFIFRNPFSSCIGLIDVCRFGENLRKPWRLRRPSIGDRVQVGGTSVIKYGVSCWYNLRLQMSTNDYDQSVSILSDNLDPLM